MINRRPPSSSATTVLLAVLGISASCRVGHLSFLSASAAKLYGAPVQLSDAEQCEDGSCHSSSYDDDYDDYDGAIPASTPPLAEMTEEQFNHYLSTIRAIPSTSWELHEAIDDVLSENDRGLLYRHAERALINQRFPDALSDTLANSGNYTDGSPAGSPSWVGDYGAQNASDPTYVSFGSVLDISIISSSSSNNNNNGKVVVDTTTIPWLASLVHRRDIIAIKERSDENDSKPCRTDLLDDYDDEYDYGGMCMHGATIDEYVTVRATRGELRNEMVRAAQYGILDMGEFVLLPPEEDRRKDFHFWGDKKFDTIFANGMLSPMMNDRSPDGEMHGMDVVIENLSRLLKPEGGTLYLMGKEPLEYVEDGEGRAYQDVVGVLDAAKSLLGVHPKHNLPSSWVHRTTQRLGLTVFRSTYFPSELTAEEMFATIQEAKEWIDELENEHIKRGMYETLMGAFEELEDAVDDDDSAWVGGHDYLVVATNDGPISPNLSDLVKDGPAPYRRKRHYEYDHDPSIVELDATPVPRGVMVEHRWANGDPYDGVSGRIGIPPQLVPEITAYVKKTGIWDLMIDTIQNDPMEQNSTRFYTVTSPYGNGDRQFTWSAKRPDNFYGSSSDMHWFDISDEAAHEDSIRALARGGFDEVLNAIGTYLGLDHLVTFSIGLLAVTKAEKGYVHVDFTNSNKRAFNLLINLDTPGDDPELTVIEEDDLGNRRRGQIKYAPDFGVLNGDDAMHATNECNHRESGGVRITASIFIAELVEESLKQVGEHDKYYFPFGNMDWIWAQRGRHWNKEGTASLVSDKGRAPFEAEDEMDDCEERVGAKKEKCLVHGPERMLCYKTCGMFQPDDVFRPGEEREKVVGW